MKVKKTERGFYILLEEKYQNEPGEFTRLVQESSAIGDDEDSFQNPGSSFLWVGQDHHLNRKEVLELKNHLQYWLDIGRLKYETPTS